MGLDTTGAGVLSTLARHFRLADETWGKMPGRLPTPSSSHPHSHFVSPFRNKTQQESRPITPTMPRMIIIKHNINTTHPVVNHLWSDDNDQPIPTSSLRLPSSSFRALTISAAASPSCAPTRR